jgi:hypothetical protein
MSIIWLSVAHDLPQTIAAIPEQVPFSFLSSEAGFASPIETTIDAHGTEIESKAQLDVSHGLADALERSIEGNDVSDEIYQEHLGASRSLTGKSLSLLKLLRQETRDLDLLGAYEITGKTAGTRWSRDGLQWLPSTIDRYSAAVSVREVGLLSVGFASKIQRLLDAGEEPLLAYDHLAEAHRSIGLRFKWVEATVAAELAIKEILVRIEPKLTTLLLEVPSPPLHKLYGEVLESAAGIRSPYVREVQVGAERRNKIIHKIEPVELDLQETLDYIETVAQAIDHLLQVARARH